MSDDAATTTIEGWAILELMGHRRLAGWISEVNVAGGAFVRIDVPGDTDASDKTAAAARTIASQFYTPAAIYCITPTTEETARAFARRFQPAPVSRWELEPAALGPFVPAPGMLDEDGELIRDDDRVF